VCLTPLSPLLPRSSSGYIGFLRADAAGGYRLPRKRLCHYRRESRLDRDCTYLLRRKYMCCAHDWDHVNTKKRNCGRYPRKKICHCHRKSRLYRDCTHLLRRKYMYCAHDWHHVNPKKRDCGQYPARERRSIQVRCFSGTGPTQEMKLMSSIL
jgi:hypothetical protein